RVVLGLGVDAHADLVLAGGDEALPAEHVVGGDGAGRVVEDGAAVEAHGRAAHVEEARRVELEIDLHLGVVEGRGRGAGAGAGGEQRLADLLVVLLQLVELRRGRLFGEGGGTDENRHDESHQNPSGKKIDSPAVSDRSFTTNFSSSSSWR